MKKLLGILVIGLLLSGNAYASDWPGLKNLYKFNLKLDISMSAEGKKCGIKESDIERNIRYIIGTSKIKFSDEYNLEQFYFTSMIKGGGDIACSASTILMTYTWDTILNKSNVPFDGMRNSHLQHATILAMPENFKSSYLNQIDDMLKNFVIAWINANGE